jgi:hypothetical protein
VFTHNFLLHCIIGHDFLLKKSSNYVSLLECWFKFCVIELNDDDYIYIYTWLVISCIVFLHSMKEVNHCHKYDMWNLFDFILVVTHHRKCKFVTVNIKAYFSKVHLTSQLLIRFMVLKGFRVESPITKHIFIVKYFLIFSSFIIEIEQFLCYWMCKLEDYKCKGTTQKTQEEDEW